MTLTFESEPDRNRDSNVKVAPLEEFRCGSTMTMDVKIRPEKSEAKSMTGPQAIARVLKLLWILADKKDGLTLSELAEGLPAPKSTLRNSLLPLLGDGFLVSEEGRFRLGPGAHRLGARIMSGWAPLQNLRVYMEVLGKRTSESAAIVRLDYEAQTAVYMDVCEGGHGIRYVMHQGSTTPLNASSSGRVLLAFASTEFQTDYLKNSKLTALTAKTLHTADSVRAELNRIRKAGYAISLGEVVPDGGAIAAPVFGPSGELICALTIAGPLSRIEANLDTLKVQVRDIARVASGQPVG